jgi:hypothetical protein
MPKKSWASEEQQTWLLAQLGDFRQAQEAKTTPGFFIKLYKNFHETWPLAPANADEISKAGQTLDKYLGSRYDNDFLPLFDKFLGTVYGTDFINILY